MHIITAKSVSSFFLLMVVAWALMLSSFIPSGSAQSTGGRPKQLAAIKANWFNDRIVPGTTSLVKFEFQGVDFSIDDPLIVTTADALGLGPDPQRPAPSRRVSNLSQSTHNRSRVFTIYDDFLQQNGQNSGQNPEPEPEWTTFEFGAPSADYRTEALYGINSWGGVSYCWNGDTNQVVAAVQKGESDREVTIAVNALFKLDIPSDTKEAATKTFSFICPLMFETENAEKKDEADYPDPRLVITGQVWMGEEDSQGQLINLASIGPTELDPVRIRTKDNTKDWPVIKNPKIAFGEGRVTTVNGLPNSSAIVHFNFQSDTSGPFLFRVIGANISTVNRNTGGFAPMYCTSNHPSNKIVARILINVHGNSTLIYVPQEAESGSSLVFTCDVIIDNDVNSHVVPGITWESDPSSRFALWLGLGYFGRFMPIPNRLWKKPEFTAIGTASFNQMGRMTFRVKTSKLPTDGDTKVDLLLRFSEGVNLDQAAVASVTNACPGGSPAYCGGLCSHGKLRGVPANELVFKNAGVLLSNPYIDCEITWNYQVDGFTTDKMRDKVEVQVFISAGIIQMGIPVVHDYPPATSPITGTSHIPIYIPTIGQYQLQMISNATWVAGTMKNPKVRYTATFELRDNFALIKTRIKHPRLYVSFLNNHTPFALDQLEKEMRCGMTYKGKHKELKMQVDLITQSWSANLGSELSKESYYTVEIMCSFVIGYNDRSTSEIIFVNALALRATVLDLLDDGYDDSHKRFPRAHFFEESVSSAEANFPRIVINAETFVPEIGQAQAVAHITMSYILPNMTTDWIDYITKAHSANVIKVLNEWAREQVAGKGTVEEFGWLWGDERNSEEIANGITVPPRTYQDKVTNVPRSGTPYMNIEAPLELWDLNYRQGQTIEVPTQNDTWKESITGLEVWTLAEFNSGLHPFRGASFLLGNYTCVETIVTSSLRATKGTKTVETFPTLPPLSRFEKAWTRAIFPKEPVIARWGQGSVALDPFTHMNENMGCGALMGTYAQLPAGAVPGEIVPPGSGVPKEELVKKLIENMTPRYIPCTVGQECRINPDCDTHNCWKGKCIGKMTQGRSVIAVKNDIDLPWAWVQLYNRNALKGGASSQYGFGAAWWGPGTIMVVLGMVLVGEIGGW